MTSQLIAPENARVCSVSRFFCLATCFGLPKVQFAMPNFTSMGSKCRPCGAKSWTIVPLVKTIPLCTSLQRWQ